MLTSCVRKFNYKRNRGWNSCQQTAFTEINRMRDALVRGFLFVTEAYTIAVYQIE